MADTRLYELEECVSPQADDILLIEESATQTDKKVKVSSLMPTDAVESAVADWLDAHPEATTTVEDGSITPVKLATSTMDLFDAKANTAGEYDDMTVGSAKQLLSKGYTENKTPYIYRASAGGDRVLEKLIGGTIAWNQLVQNADTSCTIPILRKYIARIGDTWSIGISDGTAITVDGSIRDMVFDLTQMLGSTIADYIYSLEQSTAGAGVAYFRQMFPNDYYAHDSGTLQSVNVASKKVYDSNNTLVATYTFDSDLTLRGIPKLDASNNLYYDGDVYESDGTVTRKYGVVDLGSLNWIKVSDGKFYTVKGGFEDFDDTNVTAICQKYILGSYAEWNRGTEDKIICGVKYSSVIYIRDTSYTDAQTFKTAMSGVYLVYELATPTTESADAYINPQIVDADGTEEFVDYAYSQSTRDVAVPVGHESKYMIDLREKIEDATMLPTLPTANGTYTLKCTVASGVPTLSWVAD